MWVCTASGISTRSAVLHSSPVYRTHSHTVCNTSGKTVASTHCMCTMRPNYKNLGVSAAISCSASKPYWLILDVDKAKAHCRLRPSQPYSQTFLCDDAVADEILLVGDEDDDVVPLGGPQVLQAGLGEDERGAVGDRVDDEVRVDLLATPTGHLHKPHALE